MFIPIILKSIVVPISAATIQGAAFNQLQVNTYNIIMVSIKLIFICHVIHVRFPILGYLMLIGLSTKNFTCH